MKNQRQAYLYGLATVLLWSTVASAFKLSLRHLSPVELLFYACFTSCLVLLGVLAVQHKLVLLRQLTVADWRRSFQLGLLNPFLYYLVLFKAYDLLPAQQAQPLNYTWAITLSLLSIPLLGQAISRMELLAVAVSYLGVLVISTRGDLFGLQFSSLPGVALALFSTVLWALYWIFNARDGRDPVLALLLNFLCGLPLILGYLLLTEGLRLPSLAGLGGAVYVGAFEMGIAFVLAQGAEAFREHRPGRQPDLPLAVPLPGLHPPAGRRGDPAGDLRRPLSDHRRLAAAAVWQADSKQKKSVSRQAHAGWCRALTTVSAQRFQSPSEAPFPASAGSGSACRP